jgi:hypothetical protein
MNWALNTSTKKIGMCIIDNNLALQTFLPYLIGEDEVQQGFLQPTHVRIIMRQDLIIYTMEVTD